MFYLLNFINFKAILYNMKDKKSFIWVLVILTAIWVVSLLYISNRGLVNRRYLEMENDSLTKENINLSNVLDSLEVVSKLAEENHKVKIEAIVRTYENKLKQVENKYNRERDKITQLPISEQVELLSDFIWQSDSIPKIITINQDTTIQLLPEHVTAINSAYLDLEEYNEKFYLCQATNDSLTSYLNEGMNIIELKNQQIDTYKQYVDNQEKVINNLEYALKYETKAGNKRAITFLGVGVGVGAIAVLLLK